MYSWVLTDTQWGIVNKAYARAFSQEDFLGKKKLRVRIYPLLILLKGYKKQHWETDEEDTCLLFQKEMFKVAVTGVVEKNHYQHDFGL